MVLAIAVSESDKRGGLKVVLKLVVVLDFCTCWELEFDLENLQGNPLADVGTKAAIKLKTIKIFLIFMD